MRKLYSSEIWSLAEEIHKNLHLNYVGTFCFSALTYGLKSQYLDLAEEVKVKVDSFYVKK